MAAALFLLTGINAAAEEHYYFTTFRSDSGIPNESIISCIADSDGFVWLGTKDGLCRYDGANYMVPQELESTGLLTGTISALCEDSDGDIWFSSNSGVGRYDRHSGKADRVPGLEHVMSFCIAAGHDNDVWIVETRALALYHYEEDKDKLTHYPADLHIRAQYACVDSNGVPWFTINGKNSLYCFIKSSGVFEENVIIVNGQPNNERLHLIQPAGPNHLLVTTQSKKLLLVNTISNTAECIYQEKDTHRELRAILMRAENEYWIATSDGLVILKDGQAQIIKENDNDIHSLSGNDLWSMSCDRKGNVWIGTLYNGLNLWQNNHDLIRIYYQNTSRNALSGKFVRAICPDIYGNLWIGTEDGGFNCLNMPKDQMKSYPVRNSRGEPVNIQGLASKGREVYLATHADGLMVFDIFEERIVRTIPAPMANLYAVEITSDGGILVGGTAGIYLYDLAEKALVKDKRFTQGIVHDILEDSNHGVWIGSYGGGLNYLQKDALETILISTKGNSHGLTSDMVTSLFEDSHRRIWITTEGGGVYWAGLEDLASGVFEFGNLNMENGMPSNVCSAVAEDRDGNIWISTSRGITMIDGETTKVREILFGRGKIIGDQYNYNSSYSTRGGNLYFGTTQGLFCFSPERIGEQISKAKLYITAVTAETESQRTELSEEGKSILESGSVKVRSRDVSSLSIKYAITEFSIPQAIVYNYSLSKGKNSVSGTTTEGSIRFVDIHPGQYTFTLSILGGSGKSEQKVLKIIVSPPFYQSAVAKILYGILGILVLLASIWMLNRRRDIHRAHQISKLENEKQKEIYNAKISFFTNITHELRTPLTLIKMPLDKIIKEKDYTPTSKKDLLTIQANTNRLLNLTNQLLDMRKMDSSEKKLRYIEKDVCKIVRTTCSYFDQSALEQHIRIETDIPDEPIIIPCAEDVISTIISNLLSNAVKYGDGQIKLVLKKEEDKVVIRVDSNGKLIPADESENIFKIFYQLENESTIQKSNGTGLGLPYARSMARLHNGNLYLDTAVRDCNSFVFELPLTQPEQVELQQQEEAPGLAVEKKEEWSNSRHTALVVEDDSQMRSYIGNELSDQYNILLAANGADALEIIGKQRVDIVISDIMMPIMDGCQLCNEIKSNTEFSHIPVILLTAAVGIETRMETLQVGADGYIEKPFSIDLLRANINSLFKNREITYQQFMNSPLTHFNSVTVSNVDQEYMDKLHDIIVKHLADHNLNIEMITDLLGTSKSTLYRKVKANTGLNINEYIRLCRLKQAAEMLSSQKYRINEVAYLVGFSSPSYFATSFQKQFNISPSNFVKRLKGEEGDADEKDNSEESDK